MPYKDPEKQRHAQACYYRKNRKAWRLRNVRRREEFRKLLDTLKNKPCADCKNSFPAYVMDFDHLPGSAKKFNISNLADTPSMKALEEEVAKCEVVCSNCHRIRTFKRKNKT